RLPPLVWACASMIMMSSCLWLDVRQALTIVRRLRTYKTRRGSEPASPSVLSRPDGTPILITETPLAWAGRATVELGHLADGGWCLANGGLEQEASPGSESRRCGEASPAGE